MLLMMTGSIYAQHSTAETAFPTWQKLPKTCEKCRSYSGPAAFVNALGLRLRGETPETPVVECVQGFVMARDSVGVGPETRLVKWRSTLVRTSLGGDGRRSKYWLLEQIPSLPDTISPESVALRAEANSARQRRIKYLPRTAVFWEFRAGEGQQAVVDGTAAGIAEGLALALPGCLEACPRPKSHQPWAAATASDC
jgi:hypothetical protein